MSSRESGAVLAGYWLTGNLLQNRFNFNIMTDQVKHLRLKIPQLVIALYNEAPPFRNHCIIDIKGQTHTFGTPLICQSYLRWTASLNSLLLRFKSISFTGMRVSHLKAPFSVARSTALLVFSGREFLRSSNLLSSLTCLSLRVVNCKDLIRASSGGSCAWDTICATRGAVTWRDIACSNPARSTGFSSPSPPFLIGSASSSRSLVVHVWPVIDGIRASLIACSNGSIAVP